MRGFSKPALIVTAGALLGFTSVMTGAAADHILAGTSHRIATALRYHQLYAVLITGLGLSLMGTHFTPVQRRRLTLAAILFILGIVVFSGGLYFASVIASAVYLVPVGGFLLMAGWAAVVGAASSGCWRRKNEITPETKS